MAKKSKRWRLDPAEVGYGEYSGRPGPRELHEPVRRKSRGSRKVGWDSAEIHLRHIPTDIKVIGEVPPGHYSRKELRAACEALTEKLFYQLEEKVGRHLRIPGR